MCYTTLDSSCLSYNKDLILHTTFQSKQRMAHGWNSYYHNPTLSSDPGTLNRPSDSEGTLSQHVDNYIGHHEFSSTVALHEPPVPNSSFNPHYYQNPNVANSSSGCGYQSYYSETEQRAEGRLTDKAYMQGCANRDMSVFAKTELQTAQTFSPSCARNYQEFKQDCAMQTSYLEDVSSDSDADAEDTRPSCHYAANKLFSSAKMYEPKEHSRSESFLHTGSMTVPAARPIEFKNEIGLPSKVKTSETNLPLVQDKLQSSNHIFESYKWHGQSFLTTVGDKIHVENDYPGCPDQERAVEKDCTKSVCSDTTTSVIENFTEDRTGEHNNPIGRNIASSAANIKTVENEHNNSSNMDPSILQKEVNMEYLESNHQKTTDSNWSKEAQGKKNMRREGDVTGSMEKEYSNDNESPNPTVTHCQDSDKDIEFHKNNVDSNTSQPFFPQTIEASGSQVLKCNSALTSTIDDVKSNFHLPEHQCLTNEQDSGFRNLSEMDSDANIASLSKSCLQPQSLSIDVSLCVEKELASDTVQTNICLSKDQIKNSDSLPGEMCEKSESSLKSGFDEKLTSEAENTHFTSFQDPDCGGSVRTSESPRLGLCNEINQIQSVCSSTTGMGHYRDNEPSAKGEMAKDSVKIDLDSGDPNTQKDKQLSSELELLEKESTTSYTEKDTCGSNAPSESICVDTSDKTSENAACHQESCSQLNVFNSDGYPSQETESLTVSKRGETTSLKELDCNRTNVNSDGDLDDGSSCLESCSHQNISDMNEECLSKMGSTEKGEDKNAMQASYQPASPQKSSMAQELPNQGEEENRTDLTTEKLSESNAMYGETHSRENSLCVSDVPKLKKSDLSHSSYDQVNTLQSEGQQFQLQSSSQLRKTLHPIVILATFEPTQDVSDHYHCVKCNHSTKSIDDLIEHHHRGHLMEDFQFCKTCNLYQMGVKKTDKHMCGLTRNETELLVKSNQQKKKTHIKKRYCKKCRLVFPKMRLYIRHMRSHTGKTPFSCEECGLYFAQASTLRRHRKKSLSCKRLKLQVNDDKAETKTLQEKDENWKHSSARLKECYVKLIDINRENQFDVKSSLAMASKSSHSADVKRITPILMRCATETNKKKGQERHIEEKFKCPMCPRLFQYSFNMARHLYDCVRNAVDGRKKTRDGKYRCPLCKSSFSFLNNVYRHIKAVCVREHLSQLAKERQYLRKIQKNARKTEHNKLSVEHGQKRKSLEDQTGNKTVPLHKCVLCPAVFHHSSGLYRHKKKHELFSITGKIVNYRKSVSSFGHTQKGSDTKIEVLKNGAKSSDMDKNLALSCHFCGKTLNSVKARKRHERRHRGERPYRCLECGKGFKRHAHLTSHKKIHQRRIQCTVCKKILPTIRELIQHRNVHLKKGVLKCPDCSLQFQYPAQLLRHVNTHKTGEKDLSHHDGESLKPSQNLDAKYEENVLKQLQCSLCKEKFHDSQILRKHAITHISGSSSNDCPFCKLSFNTREYLLRHMVKHTGEKPFSCTNCGKQFYRYMFMKLHIQKCLPRSTKHLVTTEPNTERRKYYNCSYCSRMFHMKDRWENHHQSHMNNSLHQCSMCEDYYGIYKLKEHKKRCKGAAGRNARATQSSKKIYTKITSQSRLNVKQNLSLARASKLLLPFKCPHCTQRFRYQSLYLRHLVSHTGIQPYACAHCDRRFRAQTLCREHENICKGSKKKESSRPENDVANHPNMPAVREVPKKTQLTSEAEFKCKFCTKSFMKPRSLRRHILTHNEVKPYHCKVCDSSFSRYDHLKVHEALCKGKKRRLEVCIPKITSDDLGKGWLNRFGLQPVEKKGTFDCEVCLRRFPAESKLSRHITMFHTTKSFKCTRCGSSFAYERSLKKHKKRNKCRKSLFVESAASSPGTNTLEENKMQDRIKPNLNKNHKHVCTYCPRVFGSKWQLDVHTCLHTGERPFPCKYCGEGFIRKDYLQRHFAKCTVKLNSEVHCDICGMNFLASKFVHHRKICIREPTIDETIQSSDNSPSRGFSCAYCSGRFLLFSQLQEHFTRTHQLETVAKPPSPVPAQHLESDVKNKEKPSNDSSDEDPGDDGSLTSELNSVPVCEVPKPFSCSYCNMSFGSKAGLKGHVRVHTKANPFKCKSCSRGFWNKTLLRNHYRKCRRGYFTTQMSASSSRAKSDSAPKDSVASSNERVETSSTSVLKTSHSYKSTLPEETQKDHEENLVQTSSYKEKKEVKYQCSECDKSFTDGLMLISHLEDHGRKDQEKKNNTCTKCGRVCSSQGNLEKHMRIHGVVKKHPCPDCSKKFFTASELEEHRTCHDPNKHYICKLCSQRFWTRPALCVHYNDEHQHDLFTCQFCSKKYASAKSRIRHYKSVHVEEYNKIRATMQTNSNEQKSSSQVSTTGESDEDDGSEDSEDSDSHDFPCHVCGMTFDTSEKLEDHQLFHLGKKPHGCAECGKCFTQASQLQQHQRMHQSEFQCQICGKGFVSLFALRKHKHTHGRSRPYRCSKCHLSFTTSSTLAEHMDTHREDNFPCDICDTVFLSRSKRDEHRKSHLDSLTNPPASVTLTNLEQPSSISQSSFGVTREFKYRCGICQERFRDPEELSEHGCMEAKERQFSCFDCDKHFLHASHLKKHKATHSPLRPQQKYSCNQCNSSFTSKDFLSHLKSHAEIAIKIKQESDDEGGEPLPTFICPVCQQCCPDATELMYHFPTHLDNSKKFGTKPQPDKHQVEEEGQPMTSAVAVKCQGCGQSFLGDEALRQHHCPCQRQSMFPTKSSDPPRYQPTEEEDVDVTGEELYNCPTCKMQLFSKSAFLEHQLASHPDDKPFKCLVCGKTFAQKRYLRKHERSQHPHANVSSAPQSKVLTYKCARCNARFSTAQDLSSHMRTHAVKEVGEFRCDMCYKSFSQLSLLRQHQESHVGEVVYECTDCDKAFAFPYLLEEHQQTHAASSQQ